MSGSGDITVWINSPGGDCVAAAQIYNMLMDYKGNVTVKIDGIAASAASKTALRKLVQYLMSKYKIPANKVLRHYDLTGKRCPAYYADETRWAALHEYITTPEVNPRTLYRVQVGAFSSKSNAEAYMAKVKAAGFGAFIVEVKNNA